MPPNAELPATASQGSQRFVASTPLGGSPVAEPEASPRRSSWRDLLVVAALLAVSVLTAVASLMSWRDYGPALNPDENGWHLADGAFGRGWVAVAVAVTLAVGGVLIASGRRTAGRVWARIGSTALIIGPMLEWAFGDRGVRSGPGIGLWVMLVSGMVLMVLLGSVLPVGSDS